MLTWMVFWMRRQAASIGRDLRHQVDVALEGGTLQEWTVSPSVASVEAGEVTFVVTNGGTMVHELTVE